MSKTHHMMLVNPTPSTLSFTLSTSSPHFTITSSPTTLPLHHGDTCGTSLSPHTGISVCTYNMHIVMWFTTLQGLTYVCVNTWHTFRLLIAYGIVPMSDDANSHTHNLTYTHKLCLHSPPCIIYIHVYTPVIYKCMCTNTGWCNVSLVQRWPERLCSRQNVLLRYSPSTLLYWCNTGVYVYVQYRIWYVAILCASHTALMYSTKQYSHTHVVYLENEDSLITYYYMHHKCIPWDDYVLLQHVYIHVYNNVCTPCVYDRW